MLNSNIILICFTSVIITHIIMRSLVEIATTKSTSKIFAENFEKIAEQNKKR